MRDGEPHRLRHAVYRVLSAGFAPVSASFLAASAGAVEALERAGMFDYAYALRVAELLDAFADADPDELDQAYRRLFGTTVAGQACTIRESEFRGNPRTGETAQLLADATAAQRRLGVEPPADGADHASTELASMSAACGRLAEHADDPSEIRSKLVPQYEFLQAHLLPWLPNLCRQMIGIGEHPAYDALGRATVAVLEHERQHVPMLLDDLEGVRR